MNPPMTINIKMYNSNDNLIHSFENNKIVNGNSYYNTYTITENIYDITGNFELILQGQDSVNSDSHTLILTVNPVQENHPPVAYDSTSSTNEDTNVQVTMSASDPDEDELDYIITDAPNHGALSGNGQTRTYIPNANWYGTDSFKFKVYDGEYYSNEATVTINVIEVPEENHPPVITSTPVTQVNEGANYVYDVDAEDEDNDDLYYSLTQAPSWLSINSQTGKITGTAPLVSQNTDYSVSVKVSDNSDFDTQDYVLTVKNINGQDTTPPQVEILYPHDGAIYEQVTQMTYRATDESGLEKCWYTTDGHTNIDTPCNSLIGINAHAGTNTWKVYAKDIYGNIGSDSVTFYVEQGQGDITPPEITIISPQNKEYDVSDILFKIRTNEYATAWFKLDNGTSISMDTEDNFLFEKIKNVNDGEHEVIFYAKDSAGNIGTKSIEFSVDTEENDNGDGDHGPREIPEDEFGKAKYLSQFVQPRFISEEAQEKTIVGEDEKKLSGNLFFWLLILILILAIFIILALIMRYRR